MFNSSFWGIVLIFIGLSILINVIFGLSLPFARIIFAALFIYGGVLLITKGSHIIRGEKILFSQRMVRSNNPDASYTIAFSKSTIDLSRMTLHEPITLNIDVFFGEGILLLPATIPLTIHAHSVFGHLKLPDQSMTQGKKTYSSAHSQESPLLTIHAQSVFGSLVIKTV